MQAICRLNSRIEVVGAIPIGGFFKFLEKRKIFIWINNHSDMKSLLLIILIFAAMIVSCSIGKEEENPIIFEEKQEIKDAETKEMDHGRLEIMKLTSPAFEHKGAIPSEYTCDGADTSPELNMADVPSSTKSFALINDDPDAPVGTWDHWIVFNIPPSVTKIEKGKEPRGVAGKNSWGRTGYGGPCPPSGMHRYFFKLYALEKELDLPEGSSKKEIEKAMEGHILAQAELTGNYKRQ
jgi:Raf kinase inhibitor-like YbhB/YbcL family protein